MMRIGAIAMVKANQNKAVIANIMNEDMIRRVIK